MTSTGNVERRLAWACIAALLVGTLRADVFSNVPEATGYTLLYELKIPVSASYRDGTSIPYSVDNSATIPFGYDRVAYYLELVSGTTTNWVYVSMDDFTRGALRTLGLPHNRYNPVAYQMIVRNANIYAKSGNGIVTGTGLPTCNIELWPGGYNGTNSKGIPGASDGTYDFGDSNTGGTGSGYSCFQVHNYGAAQTVFAYNRWGNTSGNSDVGIGSQPSGNPDWTFAQNAANYDARLLQILVREVPDDAALTATVRSRVPEAADFELLCDLPIPSGAQAYNSQLIPYLLDRGACQLPSLARIAYYMELDSKWIFVSMDAFSQEPRKLGIPSNGPNGGSAIFQTYVDNMNITASAGSGVTTGTGITTGNIEIWPSNYGGTNSKGIPGASDTLFDFGDGGGSTGSGYACFQVHNYGAAQVLFAYNRWGGSDSGPSDLGIGNNTVYSSRAGNIPPDYTFMANADGYTTKHLQIFVQPRDPATLIPEAGDYRVLYKLPIPNMAIFRDNNPVPYAIDNSAVPIPQGYDRVAYYLELYDGTEWTWVWVSMDDFVNGWLPYLALPHNQDNPVIHQGYVANMNVYASANANVTTGTGIQTGNIEMWCSNYGAANSAGIPNADGATYDFGDGGAGTAAGHGSFQVHNYDIDGAGPGTSGETLFGYNRWGGGNTSGNSDLGIGNRPTGAPDWTNAQNANGYQAKNLWILVRPRPDNVNTSLAATVNSRIPSARNYELVYDLDIPYGAAYNFNPIAYNVDRSRAIPPSLGRIAYYLELDSDWVYVSMDAFTQDAAKVGIPSKGVNGGKTPFQQLVTNMTVASSVSSVVQGTGIQTGNIEIWPSSYTGTAVAGLPPNADGTYDIGDTMTSGDHACVQVHNYDIDGAGPGHVGQTIFAYNNWGNNAAGPSAIGIGNSLTANHDWTFDNNAGTYSTRHLQILVQPRVYANVPDAARYSVVYGLSIPGGAHPYLHAKGVPYGIDWSADYASRNLGRFGRVAYYLELKKPGEALKWVFVSFDAITDDYGKIGIPAGDDGRVWQQTVANMSVYASANLAGTITTGTRISTGNIEFWPNDYTSGNSAGVPGASAATNDFGDDPNETVPQGYGSMQIHNYGAAQTIFAYNGWGNGTAASDIGIGNQPTGQPDWTTAANAGDYEVKNLFVLVQLPQPPTVISVQ